MSQQDPNLITVRSPVVEAAVRNEDALEEGEEAKQNNDKNLCSSDKSAVEMHSFSYVNGRPSKTEQELAYETSLSIDQEFSLKTLELVRILFASCGIRLKTSPGDVKHKNWSKVERMVGNIVGFCHFIAIPYAFYYRLLNGRSASFWGKLYLTIANLTPPFIYLWARLRGRKNQYALELLTTHKNVPRSVLVAVARMIIWSLITSFVLQGLYFNWLFHHKQLHKENKIWTAFFTFVGCTAYFRFMLPMLSTGVFLIHCYALRARMQMFVLSLTGSHRLIDVVNEFLAIDQAMDKSMDGWELYFIGMFLLPLVCFQIQIIMVSQHVIHLRKDYFLMIYSGLFFLHAMTILWVAGRLTEYWRHAARNIRLRLARGDLSFVSSLTKDDNDHEEQRSSESLRSTTSDNNSVRVAIPIRTSSLVSLQQKQQRGSIFYNQNHISNNEAATQGFNAFVTGCLNNPSGFVILGIVIDTQLAAYVTYIVALSALYMSRMFFV